MTDIARLMIQLDDLRPPVRRRIEVPLAIRLDDLHLVIQAVMGWENSHLYEFRVGRDIAYGEPNPDFDFRIGFRSGQPDDPRHPARPGLRQDQELQICL